MALRRILHRQYQQRPHSPRLRARMRPVLRLVRRSRAYADRDPTVRRGGLGEGAAGEPRGAGREAAVGGGAHAVRLAHHRPGDADEPGCRRARAEACRENRQDAGARCRRVAQAHRQYSDRDRARSSRPRVDLHPHLFVRAHHRRAHDEGRGSTAAKAQAGSCACTRKAASITRCRAITRSPRRYAPTSTPPALRKTARAISSAHRRGIPLPCSSKSRWLRQMRGA